ncbi:polyhydroxyalkanoate synthesis repressor PhaR [Rhodobacterales bacterium 52_120_T64]|nr:polyhydroxyalkanoate synthesis repressor PhaR [Rhodobacterales bacterium 52_120_T64]
MADTTKDTIVIKKYANRRLYNTKKSSYVTLDHLAEMVREGQDFVVTDAKSGEDITRSVLTQIIFEEESKGHNMLPTKFLRQLISLYGDSVQGFVPGYLEASMETFAKNQDDLRDQMKGVMEGNPAMTGFEALARQNMEWFDGAMRMFKPAAAVAADKTEPAPASSNEDASDVELGDLKAQLAQMQNQLSKLVDKS